MKKADSERGGYEGFSRSTLSIRPEPTRTTSQTYPHHVPKPPLIRSEVGGEYVLNLSAPYSEIVVDTSRGTPRYVPNLSTTTSEPIEDHLRTYPDHVPNVSTPISEPIDDHLRTYRWVVRNMSTPISERISGYFGICRWVVREYFRGSSGILPR